MVKPSDPALDVLSTSTGSCWSWIQREAIGFDSW